MSENSFFIPGAPQSAGPNQTPEHAPQQPPKKNPNAGSETLSHNEQGGLRPVDSYEPTPSPAPTPTQEGTSAAARQAFRPSAWRVHPGTGLAVAGFLAALLVHASVSPDKGATPTAFGLFAAGVIGSLLVSLVPFVLSRRSNAALNISMCTLLSAATGYAGFRAWATSDDVHDTRVLASVDRSMNSLSEKARHQVREAGYADVNAEDLTNAARTFSRAADNLDGDDAATLRAASAIMSDFADRSKAFAAVVDRLGSMGGFDPQTLKSKDDVEMRIALVDEFLTLNSEFEESVKSTPKRFRNFLVKEGLEQKKLTRAESEFANGFKLPLQVKLRQVEARFGEAGNAYLRVLRDQWGHWKVDASGQVAFESESMIDPFNRATLALQDSMRAEARLQRQILDMEALAELDTDSAND